MPIQVPAEVAQQIEAGALVVVNHSGGKDSQAMLIKLLEIVPAAQILVVHASLGDIEWHGALELARDQAEAAGVPFIVARAEKTFLDMVERRFAARPGVPSFPSSANRQCTSDLKRDPIDREIRRHMKAHGLTAVVSCSGIRAQESSSRAKAATLRANVRNSRGGRTWLDWAPIHGMTTLEVFATIAGAGQEPHPAYAAGNERLSCVFCIMGSAGDILRGAQARPELFARYVELEQRTGYTMHMSRRSLTEIVEQARAAA
jgi:3'-phosphoadenosine 5'-phosphosulfate sulfotransferase (PAPS reductase)/FAD synthetase